MRDDSRFKHLSELISQVFEYLSKDGSKLPIMTYDHKVKDQTIKNFRGQGPRVFPCLYYYDLNLLL